MFSSIWRNAYTSLVTQTSTPHLDSLHPTAALPGAHVSVTGSHLGPAAEGAPVPSALVGNTPAVVNLSRPSRAVIQVPEGALASGLQLSNGGAPSNTLPLRVGVPLFEASNPVGNPAVDSDGNLFVMFSGPRGEVVDVSIHRIGLDYQVRPFIRELLNVSGLAFDRDGYLYATSRSEGVVYRISPEGAVSTYAEGMGIATGIAFDAAGNLFVGDRSGTIFKIARGIGSLSGETFVFATLEPSVAAYHLAFLDDGTLLVTAPTTASHDVIHSISPEGETGVFFRGLGRPQGMAVDASGNVYVAASYRGERGIIRIHSPKDGTPKTAELTIAGNDLVGLAFLDEGAVALATRSAVFHVDLGVPGRKLP